MHNICCGYLLKTEDLQSALQSIANIKDQKYQPPRRAYVFMRPFLHKQYMIQGLYFKCIAGVS